MWPLTLNNQVHDPQTNRRPKGPIRKLYTTFQIDACRTSLTYHTKKEFDLSDFSDLKINILFRWNQQFLLLLVSTRPWHAAGLSTSAISTAPCFFYALQESLFRTHTCASEYNRKFQAVHLKLKIPGYNETCKEKPPLQSGKKWPFPVRSFLKRFFWCQLHKKIFQCWKIVVPEGISSHRSTCITSGSKNKSKSSIHCDLTFPRSSTFDNSVHCEWTQGLHSLRIQHYINIQDKFIFKRTSTSKKTHTNAQQIFHSTKK